MSDAYREPIREVSTEVKILKSRFIAHVRICPTNDEARHKLKIINEEHKQATHNCWAYRVGAQRISEYFSDGGEPAGTAGKPILCALQRQDATNVLLVVTRYFGGIKLGVRGLIDAYGSTASEGLSVAGIAIRRRKRKYAVIIPYNMTKFMSRLLESCESFSEELSMEYGASVFVQCSIPFDMVSVFEAVVEEWKGTGRILFWETIGEAF